MHAVVPAAASSVLQFRWAGMLHVCAALCLCTWPYTMLAVTFL